MFQVPHLLLHQNTISADTHASLPRLCHPVSSHSAIILSHSFYTRRPSINTSLVQPTFHFFTCGTKLIEDDWFFPGCSDSALETRQQELEEELAQARGLGQHRAKKLAAPSQRSLQVGGHLFDDCTVMGVNQCDIE